MGIHSGTPYYHCSKAFQARCVLALSLLRRGRCSIKPVAAEVRFGFGAASAYCDGRLPT
jgi:hypothetical protein